MTVLVVILWQCYFNLLVYWRCTCHQPPWVAYAGAPEIHHSSLNCLIEIEFANRSNISSLRTRNSVHWLQSPRQCTRGLICRYKDIRSDKFPSASRASLSATARSASSLKAWARITTDRMGGVATEDATERLRRDVTRSRDTWAVTW